MSNSTWKSKTGVFARKSVERTIGDTTWNFYPVSVGRLFELRDTIKDIFSAATALFTKNGDDVAQEIERIRQGDGTIERTNIAAITPEMAKFRDEQKKSSVQAAVEALLCERNKLMIGKLLADSLRDDFDRNVKEDEIKEFMEALDLASLVQFLIGFAEANAKVFGPVGEKIRAAIGNKLRLVTDEKAGSEELPPPVQLDEKG
jgi:hypothetical protein